jgi:hypothetical protein
MKKLIEGLPFYQDKLHEETVFNRFNDILVKVIPSFVFQVMAVTHECIHRHGPISLPTNLTLS